MPIIWYTITRWRIAYEIFFSKWHKNGYIRAQCSKLLCTESCEDGAFIAGKTWKIPENAKKPVRTNKKKEQPVTLLDILKEQKINKYSVGFIIKTQIDLTYNSNHIEGSRLSHDQTRYIFETNTIGVENEVLNVDDVLEQQITFDVLI